jgi:xylose isomerase
MNRLAIITSFLGVTRNRYMLYQEERTLAEKVALAAGIDGIEGLELAYPADFDDPAELGRLLNDHGLAVSAVNFRSRRSGQWWRGSFSAESARERGEVVDDLRRAMDLAAGLGCHRITTCPLNDGTDYVFEMDYVRAYDHALEAFAAACDHDPATRICIEYKMNDPRARCLLGTAGESASFCQVVNRDNLGVTLDLGHALYAGERPAHSAVLLARAGRLFYVHLNDNDGRWDWDMLPGAYHLWESVEFLYTLRKLGYTEDWYAYDVFTKEIDTAATFQAVVSLTHKLEEITDRIDDATMERLMAARDPSQTIPYLYSLL